MPDAPVIVGRYALHGAIGVGGMATVHIGRLLGPVGFSRVVAIKRLHPQCAKDPDFSAMFLDEARLAARIRHPNVVPTVDVVATESELLLVIEYVHGETLARMWRDVTDAGGLLPLPIALAILVNILAGLHAAHEATNERGSPLRIVHRDVSPQNIVVDVDGVARVLDFGVAKAMGRLHTTRDGAVKGKAAYMPPEQLRAEEVDRRADVYAASVLLWELLCGKRLFARGDDAATLFAVVNDDVPPPSTLVSTVPVALDHVVLKGLDRDREKRWGTAAEMAEAIEGIGPLATPREIGAWVQKTAAQALAARSTMLRDVEEVSAASMPVVAAPPSVTSVPASEAVTEATKTPPPSSDLRPRRRRSSFVAGAFGAAVMLVIVAAAFGMRSLVRAPDVAPAIAEKPPEPAAPSVPSASVAAPVVDVPSAIASAANSSTPPVATPKRARPAPPPPPPPPPAPVAKDDCDPPWTVDSAGVRVVKRQCLGKH